MGDPRGRGPDAGDPERHRAALRSLVAALRVRPPAGFTWLGRTGEGVGAAWRREMEPALVRAWLIHAVQSRIYSGFYTRGRPTPDTVRIAADAAERRAFEAELRAANAGAGSVEPGWRVLRAGDGDEVVLEAEGGLRLRAPGSRVVTADGAPPISGGPPVGLRMPPHLPSLSPGFFLCMGDAGSPGTGSRSGLRLYWNVDARGAVLLLASATAVLNRAGVPFRLKVLSDPSAFDRCDAGVLYCRREDAAAVEGVLPGILEAVSGHLGSEVPALTRLVVPGLGFALDPGNGESFGMHRSKLLAEGLVAAAERGARRDPERAEVVVGVLRGGGVEMDHPHRLAEDPEVRLAPRFRRRSRSQGPPRPANPVRPALPRRERLLAAAARVGRALAERAWWAGDRCNWLDVEHSPSPDQVVTPGLRSCRADLYAGTSGIALFLARLFVATGDDEFGRHARGALTHALAELERTPPDPGLYTGGLGAAIAARRAGRALGDEAAVLAAERLGRAAAQADADAAFDVMGGAAGAVVGSLLLAREADDERYLSAARAHARRLLALARRGRRGASWRQPSMPRARHLTGLSHGASGAAVALLRFRDATGDEEAGRVALEALAYEDHWFLPEHGNWPDFREASSPTARRDLPRAAAWCHGAPGIALARLEAWRSTGREEDLRLARTAAATTVRAVLAVLDVGAPADPCLCHGLSGNADVLLDVARGVPEAGEELHGTALAAASVLAARAEEGWSDDLPPGLMLGLAGVGWFLLRAAEPDTPSLLLPSPAPTG